jgi:thioredoxin 2
VEARLVRCPACGKTNRIPATAPGRPRCGNCRHDLPWIVDAVDADFKRIAEQSTVPVLIDFWAVWCGPCLQVSPVLEQLAAEKAGRIKLVKVDVDRAPGLSSRFAVQAIPTLMVIVSGMVIARQAGAAPAAELRTWLEHALSSSLS